LSDHRERFAHLGTVTVGGRPLEVENAWWHGERLILKFRGIDSMSDAEALAGAEVEIPAEERTALDANEYFLSDLIGCAVIDQKTGQRVGVVDGWTETGGPLLLTVKAEGSGVEILIPFARAICREIDVAAKRIVADLPEGLTGLNLP
jgi:16S rRNA processing protein RimM